MYTVGYLRLPSRWWYADDPAVFAVADSLRNPAGIFTDQGVMRGIGAGGAAAPMQIFSFWVDVRLGGISPRFAYGHQIASFLAAGLLLYALLLRLLRADPVAPFFLTVLWALLPSTLVVLQHIAARHYMEGLLFSALALNLVARLPAEGARRGPFFAGIFLSIAVAALCKETYAALLPAVVLLVAWQRRDRVLAAGIMTIALAYVAYRFWLLGPAISYGMPLLTVWHYLKLLSKLPYALTSNYAGYLVAALMVGVCIRFARHGQENRRILLYVVLAAALSLAAISPVAYALYGDIRTPGAWYRALFLLNTQVVFCAGVMAVRATGRAVQSLILVVALAGSAAGAHKTRRHWDRITTSAELEGKFYLDNPGKILLSTEEAWWFIPSIHWLYGVKEPHYAFANRKPPVPIAPGTPVWRLHGDKFRVEPFAPPTTAP
ncbi:MAG: hypothetical protein ACE141_04040 [Bryobacteraceae bacterium]